MIEVLDVAKKDGRWTECPSCSEIIITKKLQENLMVCPHCDFHFRLNARQRIDIVCDQGTFVQMDMNDPLLDDRSQVVDEAIIGGRAQINGQDCMFGVMDFSFKGGTMGVYLGQYIIELMKRAQDQAVPFIVFCASGGVRIQEGIWGLFQMLRTAHARNLTRDVPMITVFTDPTTGGVSASFAALADILLAEPGSRIGFAGPRVIESTLKCTLPPDFQDAKNLFSNGFLDNIIHRHDLRDTLGFLLRWF
ncbi:MAG TPA: acetyl-CoA carboxylase carboxyltransferase subunit beta [Deltaproteobacteria bacterium]|nr:acetyl-CoA carboxylase carboxyltransferase subunit beta [Deltaproteobacteria bacterium]HPJ93670.1 acetyl-CoA carboxylase carboxyltransferase subunit beta [Deltaproteobacteria bacterium]